MIQYIYYFRIINNTKNGQQGRGKITTRTAFIAFGLFFIYR
jgi:hypothetical protein